VWEIKLTEFLLIRHAVNDFVKTGKLAGWTPEVHLNDHGRVQATALGQRLASVKIDALYSSPLERTVETAQAVVEHHPELTINLLDDIGEVRYGDWQGAELSKLSQRKLWRIVQAYPSRARFPNGETMRESQMRAVNALEMLAEKHPRERVAVVSHSDIIKMIVAHFMGIHLDLFQRIEISPASLSIISLHFGRCNISQINETSYLPEPSKEAGEPVEIRAVNSITVDAIGKPGERTFYLQVGHGDNGSVISILLEKTQAMQLADEIDKWFAEHPQFAPTELIEPPMLKNPEEVMFRGGKLALQYDETADALSLEISELLGADQGTPQLVRLWATYQQLKSMGVHARQVALSGRSA
jgi:probable phosphomutase (TIGR03848 family)/uncharacterized repeat protein (TIGR03847 family)